MRFVIVGLTCIALAAGAAAARPTELRPTLSFAINAGVSDSGFGPLGGGICLGGRRITEPRPDSGVSWSPDGSHVAFYRQTGALTAEVFVADANGANLRNLSREPRSSVGCPTGRPTGAASSTSPLAMTSSSSSPCDRTDRNERRFRGPRSTRTSCSARRAGPQAEALSRTP